MKNRIAFIVNGRIIEVFENVTDIEYDGTNLSFYSDSIKNEFKEMSDSVLIVCVDEDTDLTDITYKDHTLKPNTNSDKDLKSQIAELQKQLEGLSQQVEDNNTI